MNAAQAIVGVLGGLAITGGFFVYYVGHTSPTASAPAVQLPVVVPVTPAPAPAPPSSADLQRVRSQYLADRERVRKAHPKTEAEVTKILGRPADNIMELPSMTMVQWYYDDKPDGRDVLQITVQKGVITLMSL